MKRLLMILLSVMVLFALSACGQTETTPSGNDETNPQQTNPVDTTDKANDETSPAGSTDKTDGETSGGNAEAKAIVVYLSCTGNTKAVAEKIAGLTGAELYEIVPEVPYTSADLNYNDDNCRANKEMNDDSARPAIASEAIDISQYDTVYIGYPIWWGTMPKIINTFLDTYDLSGKTVLPFCTSGSSGISTSVSAIRNIEPGAAVTDGLRASGASDNAIETWINKNGK